MTPSLFLKLTIAFCTRVILDLDHRMSHLSSETLIGPLARDVFKLVCLKNGQPLQKDKETSGGKLDAVK